MSNYKHEKLGAVTVIVQGPGEKFILVLDPFKPRPHFIKFPGGHIKPGETPVQAAVREMFEETGIDLTDCELTLLKEEYRVGKGGREGHKMYFYGVQILSFAGLREEGDEGEEVKLLTLPELVNLRDFFNPHRRFLKEKGLIK